MALGAEATAGPKTWAPSMGPQGQMSWLVQHVTTSGSQPPTAWVLEGLDRLTGGSLDTLVWALRQGL